MLKWRSYSWGAGDLSWSVVNEELLHCAELRGHQVDFISTNGTKGMIYGNERKNAAAMLSERKMVKSGTPYDLDLTYTVPVNFPQRFLPNSKVKMALYNYESSHMPSTWSNYYHLVDYVLPSSRYVADMFRRNGCPSDKIRVVPHGIDLTTFNPQIPPFSLPTSKKFKFLAVGAPHYRKQIPQLLELYSKTFSSSDDVCLVLKTKIFKDGEEIKPFEVDLRRTLRALGQQYGPKLPEILVVNEKIPNISALYTACNAFVLMTASEGWGMPFLEAMACGTPVIAPRFGGQLDFLNDNNALLTECGIRKASNKEQYWGVTPGATTGDPNPVDFAQKMTDMYNNYNVISSRLKPHMQATAAALTWDSALDQIIALGRATGRLLE